jgi:repressor LexA
MLRRGAKITQQKLAQAIGVSRSTIAMWETGASQPDNQSLTRLADYFGVSIDYLLGRDDSDPSAVKTAEGSKSPCSVESKPASRLRPYRRYWITRRSRRNWPLRANTSRSDPGGQQEPRIREGDVVIVRNKDLRRNRDTVAAMVNGSDATIKRIKIRPDGLMLIPNNPAFEPMFYSRQEIDELPVTIIGKVVELRGKL